MNDTVLPSTKSGRVVYVPHPYFLKFLLQIFIKIAKYCNISKMRLNKRSKNNNAVGSTRDERT